MNTETIELNELKDAASKILAEYVDINTLVHKLDAKSPDSFNELWEQFAELGWLAIVIPEEYGGLGWGIRELAALHEELGKKLPTIPLLSTALTAEALSLIYDEDIKSQWLPKIAEGSIKAAILLPQECKIIPDIDRSISHVYENVLFADQADLLMLPVKVNGIIKMMLIDTINDGVLVSRYEMHDKTRSVAKVQLRSIPSNEVVLVNLTDDDLSRLFNHACIAVAADSIGGASAILNATVEYLCTREQFGRPIGSFQALKHRCASWKILLEASKAYMYQAMEFGKFDILLSSQLKYLSTDTYCKIAGDAIQLHGGIGFTWEYMCHLYLKRALLNKTLYGGASMHLGLVSRLINTPENTNALAS